MADKNATNISIASAINDTDYVYVNQGSSMKQVLLTTLIAKVKTQTATQVENDLLDKLTDGCMIMYHRKSDDFPLAVKASSWTSLQNSGEIADGVIIMQTGGSGHHLVVAPTETSLYWSSSAVQASKTVYTDRPDPRKAMNDFDGEAHTADVVANATLSADGADYAPGYCYAYSRVNANGKGVTAGKWWLPSVGELWAIYANKQKINILMALITGGTTLQENAYWSSTEYSCHGRVDSVPQ